jgi:hypothetical protein
LSAGRQSLEKFQNALWCSVVKWGGEAGIGTGGVAEATARAEVGAGAWAWAWAGTITGRAAESRRERRVRTESGMVNLRTAGAHS